MSDKKAAPKRHLVIPDTQLRPGVPTEHIDWAAQAILDYLPDRIIVIGDWWDMHSLSSYDKPGSKYMEGARVFDDFAVGNDAYKHLVTPYRALQARQIANKKKVYKPSEDFFFGNHEQRTERALAAEPKYEGIFGYDNMDTQGYNRHPFLEIVELDGIAYSHYFANTHSGRPIGGSIDNRLNKIGTSFVQGHEQGFLYGVRQFPGKLTRHGLVAGSFYLHDEHYRGLQGNDEWRGIVVLNEVMDGSYDIMPLSMKYLQRKYG